MRFKAGFVTGCAVGLWAANKTAQLRRVGVRPHSGAPRSVGSRADAINAELTAEKMRALGQLARHRLNDVLERPMGVAARARLADFVGSSVREALATPLADRSGAEARRHSAYAAQSPST
ncbi:MAG TPA: hypothetical protein VKA05_05470 [Acidimicrobiales bacterium]|nr:hypothetical protein [Acidimicrobiales bacterium]